MGSRIEPGREYVRIAPDVKLGQDVTLHAFVNLYGCEIGDGSRIGTFVEIQKDATIGARVKVSSHTFICSGVTIEDGVFVGHGVMFTNDKYPRATNAAGAPQTEADWNCVRTRVRRGASIGSNATILGGVTIGEEAIVGAGSVVTRDVPARAIVAGVPARMLRYLSGPGAGNLLSSDEAAQSPQMMAVRYTAGTGQRETGAHPGENEAGGGSQSDGEGEPPAGG